MLPAGLRADENDVAEYFVKRTDTFITIDGRIDENEWNGATESPLRRADTGADAPLKTTVRLLWDDEYLYIAFFGEDDDAWSTFAYDDENLWEQEVFEVFIDPENKGHTYYELNINPRNAIVDLFILNGGITRGGEFINTKKLNMKGLKHGVFVEGDGGDEGNADFFWSAELAIPFEEFWTADYTPPKPGDMWRMNFFRIERGTKTDPDDDWQAAFSFPNGLGFHIPWRFGKVYFVK